MKKLAFLLFLCGGLVHADGPIFQHKDTFDQQEFENVYQNIRTINGLTATSSSLRCIDLPTFCVDITNHRVGIGTSTPASLLTISGAFSATSETLTATSNQVTWGTTRTVTITAPTPATASRTWTIPDVSENATFSALEATQTFSGIDTFAGQLIGKGTATNDNAAAGYIGETIETSTTSFSNFPASGVIGDLTSIIVTPGHWSVSGLLEATANGATVTSVTMGIDTVAGNSGTCGVLGKSRQQVVAPTSATSTSGSVPAYTVKVTANTPLYLKYLASYTVATPQAVGSIRAVRVR